MSKECKGKHRTGLDGKMWVSKADVNGVYRWVRLPEHKPHSVRADRACGSATRVPGRWTRAELQQLAKEQGIPYSRRTLDTLCDVLRFEPSVPVPLAADLLIKANALDVPMVDLS